MSIEIDERIILSLLILKSTWNICDKYQSRLVEHATEIGTWSYRCNGIKVHQTCMKSSIAAKHFFFFFFLNIYDS